MLVYNFFYILASFSLLQNEYPFDPASVFNPDKSMITLQKTFFNFFFRHLLLFYSFLLFLFSPPFSSSQYSSLCTPPGEVFQVLEKIDFVQNCQLQRRDGDGFLRDIFHQDRSKQYNTERR